MKVAAARSSIAHLVGFAVFAGAEALLFLTVASHHYAWFYPQWNDQVQYLGQSYGTYEFARNEGYARAVWAALNQVYAQGCLHELLTLPIFAAVGASRTAALSVNILAFIAWQAATFLAVRRISGGTQLAWASVGLLAALHFPWAGNVGSAVDFRLDWMAACAYGGSLAVALLGRGFRSTPWAIFFGAAVGATVLLRFLTVVYFGLIFFVLVAWLLTTPDWRRRCARLVLSGAVALCLIAPEFLRSRGSIYSYYWIGHYVGPERALRDSHLDAGASARWIILQIVTNQVGVAAVALGIGTAAIFHFLPRRSGAGEEAAAETKPQNDGAWLLAFVFLAAPAVVLGLHPEKSDPPSCILIPGATWLILLLWIRVGRRADRRLAGVVGAGAFLVGVMGFVHAELEDPKTELTAIDCRKFNGLSDFLFSRAEEAGLSHPVVAVNWIVQGLDAPSFRILGYERHGRMLDFVESMPTGIYATSDETVMNALKFSDFVCIVTRSAQRWPFDRQMAALLPTMRQWCDGHMTHVGFLDTEKLSVSVYERYSMAHQPNGVEFASVLAAALRGPAFERPAPIAAPVFTSVSNVVGSTRAEFRCRILAAHSPVRYEMTGLPDGLTFDARTGEISGRFHGAGVFTAQASAFNSLGSATEKWEVHVEDSDWFAYLDAPAACLPGVPFDVKFGAYDRGGTLDFIDVTDLTTRRTLERLPVPEGDRQSWSGTYRLTLQEAGPHLILMRFARFDPSAKEPYSFVDHAIVVDAKPRR